MKKLFILAAVLALSLFSAKADSIATLVTAGAASNLFTTGKIIDNITVTATSTNVTTFKFYDTSTTTTSYVQGATVRYASYATNVVVVFTNEANVVITNTYAGTYTYPITVANATSSIPAVQTIIIPGGATRSKDLNISTIRGLTVVPNQDGIVEVTYRNNP